MKKFALILFSVIALGLLSCTRVEFSDATTTLASFSWNFKSANAAANPIPDSLVIALARTVNTIRDTVIASSADPDTVIIENGDYYCVACGWDRDKKNSYTIKNLDQFLNKKALSDDDPRVAGIMDLYAQLPSLSADDLPDDMDVSEKELYKILFPKTETNMPVVPQADSLWVSDDHRELQWKKGGVDFLDFPLTEKTMYITVRVRFISDDESRVVENVAACLIGVPSRVKLQNGTVGTDGLGRTVFKMTSTDKGKNRVFSGKIQCLGLFPPVNGKDKYSYGVLHLAFQIQGEDIFIETKINLGSVMSKVKLFKELEDTDRYLANTRNAVLDIAATKQAIHIEKKPSGEEGNGALVVWQDEGEDSNIDVIPEGDD